MKGLLPVAAVGAVLWLLSQGERVDEITRPGNIDRSLLKLVPAFRYKVELLLQAMRAEGHDPLVWETYRSPARAAKLAQDPDGAGPKRPVGIALSMHTLGLALDVVDARLKWKAPAAFRASLRRNALRLGLGVIDDDAWHVQAGPATAAWQNKMRAATPSQREELLRRQYA